LVNLVYCQEYINQTCKWKIKDLALVELYYINADYQDYIAGDTIIGDSTYFKVYRKGKAISGITPTDSMFINEIHEYKGAILEENKKWHWIEKETTDPILLYDFNVSEGDSITYLGSDIKYELQLIDSIYQGGTYKKVYQLEGLEITLIEGVGWNTGLISPLHIYESFSYIQCFNKDGENLNPDLTGFEALLNIDLEEVENCSELSLSIEAETNKDQVVDIYPNPFVEKLTIQSTTEIEEVIITNKLGEIIYHKDWHTDQIELRETLNLD